MSDWFIQGKADVVGPLKPSDLVSMIRSGEIRRDTLLRKDDSQWVAAGQVNGLFEAAASSEAKRICPYCGGEIERPPATCGQCGRRIEVSFTAKPGVEGRKQSAQAPPEDPLAVEERSRRRDIFRYSLLIVGWMVLLVVAAYANQLALAGGFGDNTNLVIGLIAGLVLLVGGMFYWIIRAA